MKNIWKIAVTLIFITAVGAVVLLKNDKVENKSTVSAEQKLPRLLELGSHNCIPCKMMVPVLDSLRSEYSGALAIDFIDVWEERTAGETYGIRSIPTQIFYNKEGAEIFRHEGFWSKGEIENKFRELGVEL